MAVERHEKSGKSLILCRYFLIDNAYKRRSVLDTASNMGSTKRYTTAGEYPAI